MAKHYHYHYALVARSGYRRQNKLNVFRRTEPVPYWQEDIILNCQCYLFHESKMQASRKQHQIVMMMLFCKFVATPSEYLTV